METSAEIKGEMQRLINLFGIERKNLAKAVLAAKPLASALQRVEKEMQRYFDVDQYPYISGLYKNNDVATITVNVWAAQFTIVNNQIRKRAKPYTDKMNEIIVKYNKLSIPLAAAIKAEKEANTDTDYIATSPKVGLPDDETDTGGLSGLLKKITGGSSNTGNPTDSRSAFTPGQYALIAGGLFILYMILKPKAK